MGLPGLFLTRLTRDIRKIPPLTRAGHVGRPGMHPTTQPTSHLHAGEKLGCDQQGGW